MNKRILKRSLAVLLASVGVSVDMNTRAVKIYDSAPRTGCLAKNTKIISMKDYADKDGKVIPTAVPQAKEANWFKPLQEFKTLNEMLNFLETHKRDIFYVMMTEGLNFRRTFKIMAGRDIFRAGVNYINKKRKKEAEKAGKKYEKKLIPTTVRALGDEKLKAIDKVGNWSRIGRAMYLFPEQKGNLVTPSNRIKTEIEQAKEGSINCTGWATFINWFLNMNGIPSRELWLKGHRCVCVPLREEYEDEIKLYRIEIDEHVNSVEEIKFMIEPLTTGFNGQDGIDPWDFMAWDKPETGWGNSYAGIDYDFKTPFVSAPSKKAYNINPSMAYLQLIQEGIRNVDDKHSLKAVDGYVLGLVRESGRWFGEYEDEEKLIEAAKNGRIRYRAAYLPRDRHGILIPLNLEDIGDAVEKNSKNGKKRLFNKSRDRRTENKLMHLILVRFNLPDAIIEELKKTENEYFLEMGFPEKMMGIRNEMNAKGGIGVLEGTLSSSKTNKKMNLRATVTGLPNDKRELERIKEKILSSF